MQGYKEIALTDIAKEAVMQLQENIKVVATSYAGSAFPTANLYDGLVCYRTDEKRPYVYSATSKAWEAVGVINADYATEAEKATQDASGNVIATTYATKEDISSLAKALKYKGSVSTYSELPTAAEIGDVWNVQKADKTHGIKAGENVAWSGEAWDNLGGTVDLTDYALVADQLKDVISASSSNATITLIARDGTNTALTVNNVAHATAADTATTATSATKATQDGSGNVITSTYAKKTEIPAAYTLPTATSSTLGGIKVGTGLSISSSVLSVAAATTSTIGGVKVGSNLSVSSGTISVPLASTSTAGVVKIGSNLSVSSGTISVPTTSTSTAGVMKVGSNLSVSSGTVSVPTASTSTAGVVKVGSYLTISSSGVLAADIGEISSTDIAAICDVLDL